MNIGGVTLDNDLTWTDEFKYTEATGTATETIYGNLVVQTMPRTNALPLTLSGDANSGWQKRSTVQALVALAKSGASTIHVVQLADNRTVYAMFRNEEGPTVEFTPITRAVAPGADFWYYGTVKMRIVG
jgi:hypothetical protein